MKVLSHKHIFWAYEQWCLGYTLQEIADALHVCTKTLQRAFSQGRLKRMRPILKAPSWGEEEPE